MKSNLMKSVKVKMFKSNILLSLIILLCAFEVQGQISSTGSETLVNTTIASHQQNPAVVMRDNGNYIVVWESLGQDGDGYGIFAQAYNADGTALNSEFQVNNTTANDQRFPDISMNEDGDFYIVWQSYDQDGDSWGVYMRRYDKDFNVLTSQRKVNDNTSGSQCFPKIALDHSGECLVVWEDQGDIYVRGYNESLSIITSAVLVNTTTAGRQTQPEIAVEDNGDAVIVWQSYDQDGDGFGIYSQRIDSDANLIGSETLVNTTTTGNQINPSVSRSTSGRYVITWTDQGADGDAGGIFGQIYNNSGVAQGSEFQINTTTTGSQDNSAVAMTEDGDFTVVWNSLAQDGSAMGVYNQSYNKDGVALGSETAVNTTTNHFQQFPAVDMWSETEVIIVWQDGNLNQTSTLDTDGYGVVFQLFDELNLPVELLYFYAEKANNGVQLDWQTATEINNSHFEVEWSIDGISFQNIGEVAGAGSTNEIQFYDLLHQTPANGINYYRLKQVDFNGEYEYSDILQITIETANQPAIKVFPNPATDYITIENTQENETVQIFSTNGQFVETFQIQNAQSQIAINHLPKGTYFFKINDTVKRILIQ